MEEFLGLAQRWQFYYNVHRPHFGAEMGGLTPIQKLRALDFDLPNEFGAFPVLLLDEVAMVWAVKGGHDVLAYYTPPTIALPQQRSPAVFGRASPVQRFEGYIPSRASIVVCQKMIRTVCVYAKATPIRKLMPGTNGPV